MKIHWATLHIPKMTMASEEILDNHGSYLHFFEISIKYEELDLPSVYRMHTLHKCPDKQGYIARSAKCSTKPLSKLLSSILSVAKPRLQNYYDTRYSRDGMNQIWILKNSKDLLTVHTWYNQGPISLSNSITHLTSLHST